MVTTKELVLLAFLVVHIVVNLFSIQFFFNGIDKKNFDICEQSVTFFPNRTVILQALKKAEEFHKYGGNLKSLQEYLDPLVDETYKMFNIRFYPTDHNGLVSNSSLPRYQSISDHIRKEKKKRDQDNLGGYRKYQRKIPGKFKPDSPALRENRVEIIEPFNLERWKAGMGPIGPECKDLDRISLFESENYEDKFMCSFISNSNEEKESKNCDIISIGSNDQWSFESAVIATNSECTTHTFDCTINPEKKPISDSILFYPICISGKDEVIDKRSYMTYHSLWKISRMKQAPKLLKMDVEGYEYDVLTSMLQYASENNLKGMLPEQISVELHYLTNMHDLPWYLRFRQAGEISMLIGTLYNAGGYLPVMTKFDEGCKCCLEVLFVRILCEK